MGEWVRTKILYTCFEMWGSNRFPDFSKGEFPAALVIVCPAYQYKTPNLKALQLTLKACTWTVLMRTLAYVVLAPQNSHGYSCSYSRFHFFCLIEGSN